MDLAVRYHRVPVQPKPLRTLPQPIGIVDGAALSAAGAEERSAGVGYGAAAAAGLNRSRVLCHMDVTTADSPRGEQKSRLLLAVLGEHMDV
jgi:hypothetical protein